MMNKNARTVEIQKLGENYFAVSLPNGAEAGTKFTFSLEDQKVLGEIRGGVINNSHLFRRWVMAQTFRALHWNGYNGKGYNAYVKSLGFKYQFDMMEDEIKALAAMERDGDPELAFRSRFFSLDVIKEVYRRFTNDILRVKTELLDRREIQSAKTYREMLRAVRNFRTKYSYYINWGNRNGKLSQYKEWFDAFKGAGAYYTLENMFRFHNCILYRDNEYIFATKSGEDAVRLLRKTIDDGMWEGYQLFALLKKVIKDNHFNFGSGQIYF